MMELPEGNCPNPSNVLPNNIKVMNENCTLPSAIANAFNQHFVSSVAHITSNVQVCEPNVLYYETTTDLVARFSFEPVTECFVSDEILKMNSRKATGNDNISCRLLKLACPIMSVKASPSQVNLVRMYRYFITIILVLFVFVVVVFVFLLFERVLFLF